MMKFSYKLLLWTILIMAVAFGVSGYLFVNFVFETAMERETNQALDESNILQFAFETAALNVPTKYDLLQNAAVREIGSQLERGSQGSRRLLRISDEAREVLYASEGFAQDSTLLQRIGEDNRVYQTIPVGERYYIQTGILVNALDRKLYLETMRDVTEVFQERTLGFSVYRRVTLAMLVSCSVIMFFISSWLTKPIRILTRATRRMADGDYGYRARQVSGDELGSLTVHFNRMADALEENIEKLQEEVRAREDFIAAFAHELKTPLTAIIGYADMLRSRRLDEEKQFMSASYIYTEGKRLEAMSLRLLDIIVTGRESLSLQPVSAASLMEYLKGIYGGKGDYQFFFSYEEGTVYAESNLIKSVLMNLADNACKASENGGRVEIYGKRVEGGYAFQVTDYGIGIPREEIKKVTEPFYMVDKSRSRKKNGAGLGLALCAEILRLHNSQLQLESQPGEGTSAWFVLPDREEVQGR